MDPDNIFIMDTSYKLPFDWETLLHYYSKHQIPFIEEISDTHYQRIFKIDSSVGVFSVQNNTDKTQLEIKIHCPDTNVLPAVVERIRNMFDLDCDPLLIGNQFAKVPFLNDLWNEFPGLRIAKGWDPFEIALGTILGQVVSVQQASRLMGDLVTNYGEKIRHPMTGAETFLFPTPKVLVSATLDEIKTTTQRKNSIRELSQRIIDNEISFIGQQDPEEFKKQLKMIKGIGNWSAEYISLRGLGDTNAFPKDDLLLNRALLLNAEHLDPDQLAPWRGYLAIYLWKKYAVSLSKQRGKK